MNRSEQSVVVKVMQRVDSFIRQHHLLTTDATYVVALSGGADSVALLLMLQQLGYSIEAAHCNFHLRGEESQRDEQFCKDLCQKQDIPLHLAHFDTSEYARLHHVSIEMAARELRYGYFEQLANDIGAKGVCVAHHRDDSVETVILNLIRGTGINGLHGIQPCNGIILRPLLCLSRSDIEQYLALRHQAYVTDSTNLIDDVARNKIRLQVLPAMRRVNPSVEKCICATARHIEEASKALNAAMEEKRQRLCYTRRLLGGEPLLCIPKDGIDSEYLLFYILQPYGFAAHQVESVYAQLGESTTGMMFESDTHQLLFDRNTLLLRERRSSSLKPLIIPEPGTYLFGNHVRLHVSTAAADQLHEFPYKNDDWACLDADQVAFPLVVREVGQGDTFIPLGMKGKKLLSDFMTDCKLSLFDKQAQLVVTQADGNVIWLVNQRPDQRCRVTANTRQLLVIHCEQGTDK